MALASWRSMVDPAALDSRVRAAAPARSVRRRRGVVAVPVISGMAEFCHLATTPVNSVICLRNDRILPFVYETDRILSFVYEMTEFYHLSTK